MSMMGLLQQQSPKRYSKAFDMIFNSIFLFFNKKHLETILI